MSTTNKKLNIFDCIEFYKFLINNICNSVYLAFNTWLKYYHYMLYSDTYSYFKIRTYITKYLKYILILKSEF